MHTLSTKIDHKRFSKSTPTDHNSTLTKHNLTHPDHNLVQRILHKPLIAQHLLNSASNSCLHLINSTAHLVNSTCSVLNLTLRQYNLMLIPLYTSPRIFNFNRSFLNEYHYVFNWYHFFLNWTPIIMYSRYFN